MKEDYGRITQYYINNPVRFTEQNHFKSNHNIFKNEIELTHAPSKNKYLNFKNSISLSNNAKNTQLKFNSSAISQLLKSKKRSLESNLNYSEKIKNGAFLLYGYLGHKNLDDDFNVAPVSFSPDSLALRTTYQNQLNYQGLEANLVFKKNKFSYSFWAGVKNSQEEFSGETTTLNDNNEPIDSLSGSNKTHQFQLENGIKVAYNISEKMSLNGKLTSFFINYKNSFSEDNFFLINPEISYHWHKTKFGNFRLSYHYEQELPRVTDIAGFGVLTSYRSIDYGAKKIEALKQHRYSFSYNLPQYKERFLLSAFISYVDYENKFLKENSLSENFNATRLSYSNREDFLNLNTGVTTYIDAFNISAKIGYNQIWFSRPSILNNQFSIIDNQSQNFYLSATSYFKGGYDLRLKLNYRINTGRIQANKTRNENYSANLENILRINNRLFLNIKNNIFLINKELYESSLLNIEYRPERSAWIFGLNAQNLFKTEYYRFETITDFQQTQLRFKSVPRFLLLYAKLRI